MVGVDAMRRNHNIILVMVWARDSHSLYIPHANSSWANSFSVMQKKNRTWKFWSHASRLHLHPLLPQSQPSIPHHHSFPSNYKTINKVTKISSLEQTEREKKLRDMKEGTEVGAAKRKGVRSETEKHKTKMRERQRRAITTNIFLGLRKQGGYRLSPRADINQVLRHLANEAGWIVDPDGTTYRSSASVPSLFPLCSFSSIQLSTHKTQNFTS